MKSVKSGFLSSVNLLIGSLLTVLGFGASCERFAMMEYGTPSAKFIVSGQVRSAETNLPIQNVRVIMKNDTTYTNAAGEYEVEDRAGMPITSTYSLKFRDIREESLKQYSDLDTAIEFKNPVFTGGDNHWYKGETEKDFDVKLKAKK